MDTDAYTQTAIDVAFQPATAPPFSTLVSLRGEHDLATSGELRETLASLHGDVLLDLSECGFVDSSVLYVIVAASQQRAHDGARLELVVPAENIRIRRTLEITGVGQVLKVHAQTPSS